MKLRVVKQDNHGLCLAVDGINSDFMERYKVLARPNDDDKLLKTGFEAWASSLMRIFKIVQMESRNDDDLGIAEEVSNWLREIPPQQQDGLRNFELGCLALQLGEKHQIPLVIRQHSMNIGTGLSSYLLFISWNAGRN
jgi:hypothetical protein